MGCDGGTIPRRDEMVKLKKKAEKVSPPDSLLLVTSTCNARKHCGITSKLICTSTLLSIVALVIALVSLKPSPLYPSLL